MLGQTWLTSAAGLTAVRTGIPYGKSPGRGRGPVGLESPSQDIRYSRRRACRLFQAGKH